MPTIVVEIDETFEYRLFPITRRFRRARALDGLGLFDVAPSCLEELLVRVQWCSRRCVRGLAAPLPETRESRPSPVWTSIRPSPGSLAILEQLQRSRGAAAALTFGMYFDQATPNLLCATGLLLMCS